VPLILLLLICAAVTVFIAVQWTATTRSRELIDHSHRVIETALVMVKEMVDAETGQRGFLITADENYLGPLKAALVSIPDRIGQLRRMTQDNPGHLAHIATIERLWQERLLLIETTVAHVRAGDRDAAIALIREGQGRLLMDQIRAEADHLQSEERTLLT